METCRACGREEGSCSLDPCAMVLADRGEITIEEAARRAPFFYREEAKPDTEE